MKLKGISPVIGYVLATLITVIVIGIVSVLGYSFYDVILEDQINRDMEQVASQVSSEIIDVYAFSKSPKTIPEENEVILISSTNLNLPAKIATKNYKIILVSSNEITTFLSNITLDGKRTTFQPGSSSGKLIIETTQDPQLRSEHELPNVGLHLQGMINNPEDAKMRYYRYNFNNSIEDVIVIGESSLIGRITSVS